MALAGELPEEFKAQFRAYVRLEPRCRSDEFSRGLAAATADPLWMLTRQWQTGELAGEDAGSPVKVALQHGTQPLTRMRLGEGGAVEDLPDGPLEPVVEHEQTQLSWRDRVQIGQRFEQLIQAEVGDADLADVQAVIAAYRDHGTDGVLDLVLERPDQEWPGIDRATRRFLLLVAGRVLDGAKLLTRIDLAGGQPHRIPALGGLNEEQVNHIVARFTQWCAALNIRPELTRPKAWRNPQLDYRFELNPPEQDPPDCTHLIAPDYRNGALDWHTFNGPSGSPGAWTSHDPVISFPMRVSVGGSSPRWWAFEDAATNFGSLDVTKLDLARLLLMQFVLINGDDWFFMPLPVAMPSLVKIESLRVSNVFGEHLEIPAARQPHNDPLLRFDLFTLSPVSDPSRPCIVDPDAPGSAAVLLIPPITGYREESPPTEEIRFLRDENANKVWGVEHVVTNGLGRPVDGFDAQRERTERRREAEIIDLERRLAEIASELAPASAVGIARRLGAYFGRLFRPHPRRGGALSEERRAELKTEAAATRQRITLLREGPKPSTGGVPRYRLATTVPGNWIPFAPFNANVALSLGYTSIRLRRAQMLRNADDEEPEPIPAMSRLFDLEEDPLLWLEETTVPRSGVRVYLTGQRLRWTNGRTYVWRGRKVLAGRGEGSSGLEFDVVLQPDPGLPTSD